MTNLVRMPQTSLALARASLDDACSDLDDAVRSLSDLDGETVMANPELVGLLLRVVSSRRLLKDVEHSTPKAAPPASLR